MESQKKHSPRFSIEFFPPKTDKGWENLRKNTVEFSKLKPAYFSVTFGAGGSTQDGTFEAIKLITELGQLATPHLSCIGSTHQNIRETLKKYQSIGVKSIVALRGDLPSGMGGVAGELRHANELVEFIRAETGDYFHIEVAAYPEFHPQAKNAESDLENFKRKIDAGANSAITQYFYNVDAYFNFVNSCEKLGLNLPIVPGIMPITNYVQLARFSDMCGAEIPQWIRKRLLAYGEDIDSIRSFGYDVTLKLCQDLLNAGVAGIHFYSMNKLDPTTKLWRDLALT